MTKTKLNNWQGKWKQQMLQDDNQMALDHPKNLLQMNFPYIILLRKLGNDLVGNCSMGMNKTSQNH